MGSSLHRRGWDELMFTCPINGEYHEYVHEGYFVRCVHCFTEIMKISLTPKWKEYEK